MRIALATAGYYLSSESPWMALSLWILAACLGDCHDNGGQRHKWRQQKHNIVLELLADHCLRTLGWAAVATTGSHHSQRSLVTAVVVVLLEWTTLLTCHVHATWDCNDWRRARAHDPTFVRAFFRNQMQNPLGRLGSFGLFAADLVCYADSHNLSKWIPFFGILATAALMGRLMVATVELWLCASSAAFVMQHLRAKQDLVVKYVTDTVRDLVARQAATLV